MKWENRLGCKYLSVEMALHGAMQRERFLATSLKQGLWWAVEGYQPLPSCAVGEVRGPFKEKWEGKRTSQHC